MSFLSGKRSDFTVASRGLRPSGGFSSAVPGPITAERVVDPERLDSGISVDLVRDKFDRATVDAMDDFPSTTPTEEDAHTDFVCSEETLKYPEEEGRVDSGFHSGQGLAEFALPTEIRAFVPNNEGDQ